MKKLLLTLGAVASVAAPVAAVVACGSTPASALDGFKKIDIATINSSVMTDTEKTTAIEKINGAKTTEELTAVMGTFTNAQLQPKQPVAGAVQQPAAAQTPKTGDAATKDSITELLKSKGYTITTAQATVINNALLHNADFVADSAFKFGRIEAGKEIDGTTKGTDTSTHDSDDFIIIINGGTQKDASTKIVPGNLEDLTSTDTKNKTKAEWGTFTAADFKDATSIIYLHKVDHTKETPAGTDDSWITINPVVKSGSAIKEVEGKPVTGLGIVQIKISGTGHEDFPVA